jgi:hypothetical protein
MLGTLILLLIIFLVFQLYWNGLVENMPPPNKKENGVDENVPNLR